MNRKKTNDESLKRRTRQAIMFNQREMKAIEHYCRKFRVDNRSKFMREAIITEVLKKFDENYPTLWEDAQLKLF
jgi:hypothetical protein